MIQLSKNKILPLLVVLYCSMNVYTQQQTRTRTTTSEIKEALGNLEDHEKKLANAKKFVQENNEKIKYWENELKKVSSNPNNIQNSIRIKGSIDYLKKESKTKYTAALENFKIALANYNASIQWITDLTKKAKETYDIIEGTAIINSNKKRALAAVSNGIEELNGAFSNIGPSLIDMIGEEIRMDRPAEQIKKMLLEQVEYKNDKVAIDALIDILIDAKKKLIGGEDNPLNKIDAKFGKAMRVVKVLKVFDGGKDNMERMLDLLDLSSDLPTDFNLPNSNNPTLLTLSWYIKIQAYIVESISEVIDDLELSLAYQNLERLQRDVYKNFRLKGDVKNWAAKETDLFGKIPPEPSLKLDKSEELPIYKPGTDITVHFEGSHYWISKGWVGLVPSQTKHNSSKAADKVDLQYYYLPNEYGKLTFKAPSKSGVYDIRMFESDPGVFSSDVSEEASVSFKVDVLKEDPIPLGWVKGTLYNSNDGTCGYKGQFLIFRNVGGNFKDLKTGVLSPYMIVPSGEKLEVVVPSNTSWIRVYSSNSSNIDTDNLGSSINFYAVGNLRKGWWYTAGCKDGTYPNTRCDNGNGQGYSNQYSKCDITYAEEH